MVVCLACYSFSSDSSIRIATVLCHPPPPHHGRFVSACTDSLSPNMFLVVFSVAPTTTNYTRSETPLLRISQYLTAPSHLPRQFPLILSTWTPPLDSRHRGFKRYVYGVRGGRVRLPLTMISQRTRGRSLERAERGIGLMDFRTEERTAQVRYRVTLQRHFRPRIDTVISAKLPHGTSICYSANGSC